ncbi:MAG TPA: TIM barrel protein [Phycisphaerae bacterium]|nr:TIM barrel protein [Phycisphaerae bacterium]
MKSEYKFSFGPWNIHSGADPFGPAVRKEVPFARKVKLCRELGFHAMQFHDDDAVPQPESKTPAQLQRAAAKIRRMLEGEGLAAEFVAPRLWEHPLGIDGAYTSNDPKTRRWANERSLRAIDIARALGTKLIVLWLAREGTYLRESKNGIESYQRLLESINHMLRYDPEIEIAVEPKPNEPTDHAYLPTIGHALAMASQTSDPSRVGGLIETAHAMLAGLDPSDEMAFALSMDKLWGVHLNDQNGLKFDEDKAFGMANLRGAYNQVRILELGGYAATGRYVGLDVKALRTQKDKEALRHLSNSRRIFLALVEKVRTFDRKIEAQCVARRDYEALDLAVTEHLMGL